jgi:hypothetical protein
MPWSFLRSCTPGLTSGRAPVFTQIAWPLRPFVRRPAFQGLWGGPYERANGCAARRWDCRSANVSCAARAHARLPGVFHGRAAGGAGRQSGQAGFGGQDRRFGRALSPGLEVFSGSSGLGNVESIEKCADSQVPADEECDVNKPLPAKGMLGSLVQGCIDGVLRRQSQSVRLG